MLLGRQGRREGFKRSLGRREAFKGITLLTETRRKSPGKHPAGGQRTCCWATKRTGKGLRAAYCLALLSETKNMLLGRQGKAPSRWPKDMLLGHQAHREGFKGSLLPSVAF